MMPETEAIVSPTQEGLPNIPGYRVFSWQEWCHDHFAYYVHHANLYPILSDERYRESKTWIEEGMYFVRMAFDAISMGHNEKVDRTDAPLEARGYRHLGDIVGSIARTFIAGEAHDPDDNYSFFEATRQYRNDIFGPAFRNHPLFDDPVYKEILNGPFDVGIRVNIDAPEEATAYLKRVYGLLAWMCGGQADSGRLLDDGVLELDYIVSVRLANQDSKLKKAKIHVREKNMSYGKFTIDISLIDPENYLPAFTMHISNLDEYLESNMRLGDWHSTKQNARIPVYRDTNEEDWTNRSELMIMTEEAYNRMVEDMRSPDFIKRVHYASYEQAIYAGLRMVWHAVNWPPQDDDHVSDFISEDTIVRFRQELRRLWKGKHAKQKNQEIERQIQTLAILCADKDPKTFFRLISALGIIDVFDPHQRTLSPRYQFEREDEKRFPYFPRTALDDARFAYKHVKEKIGWQATYPRWELFNNLGSAVATRMLSHLAPDAPVTPDMVKEAFTLR